MEYRIREDYLKSIHRKMPKHVWLLMGFSLLSTLGVIISSFLESVFYSYISLASVVIGFYSFIITSKKAGEDLDRERYLSSEESDTGLSSMVYKAKLLELVKILKTCDICSIKQIDELINKYKIRIKTHDKSVRFYTNKILLPVSGVCGLNMIGLLIGVIKGENTDDWKILFIILSCVFFFSLLALSIIHGFSTYEDDMRRMISDLTDIKLLYSSEFKKDKSKEHYERKHR